MRKGPQDECETDSPNDGRDQWSVSHHPELSPDRNSPPQRIIACRGQPAPFGATGRSAHLTRARGGQPAWRSALLDATPTRSIVRGSPWASAANPVTTINPPAGRTVLGTLRLFVARHPVGRFSNRPSGSSTFRLSTTPVSTSLTGSRFSSDSAQEMLGFRPASRRSCASRLSAPR